MDPWTEFAARHRAGDVVRATVTRTLPFGALVDVEGVPGLLTPAGAAVGDIVSARIETVDGEKRRVALVTA